MATIWYYDGAILIRGRSTRWCPQICMKMHLGGFISTFSGLLIGTVCGPWPTRRYVQPTNRYVFPVLKSTCSYVKNSLFLFYTYRIFFKAKKKIPIGMFFDEANFIAELFWRASSPVWWDSIWVSLLIPSHTSSSSKFMSASYFLGELWCFVVLRWCDAIWIYFVSHTSHYSLCVHWP